MTARDNFVLQSAVSQLDYFTGQAARGRRHEIESEVHRFSFLCLQEARQRIYLKKVITRTARPDIAETALAQLLFFIREKKNIIRGTQNYNRWHIKNS